VSTDKYHIQIWSKTRT